MKMFFGVFPDADQAQTAHEDLQKQPNDLRPSPDSVHVVVHEHEARQQALRRTGGIVWPLAMFTALLFGGAAALALALVVRGAVAGAPAEPAMSQLDSLDVVLLSLGIAVLGGSLAAILAHMWIRARVRRLENELAEGRALLLVVGPKHRRRAVLQGMSNVGAVRTGTF
ncbi:hypothetical protein DB30_07456 [Enhygromyxa salina]|uniref:Uncharacterized protein n=1 Tax=Enhygromyxa salina TaxID=215803 RepID=A0A0C1ZS51_9BACT|nr:hypothetical protein [Enhygromyxa salina]KIG13903.1 hypothetical protein DB30_07456 [Enhygromyxa salina]